ncbi:hypothetical protein AAFC00_000018 [Neodothiora populina]|uniref:1-(5-phosphoribosyl)-5-[(5-phosphoribosylamino)methylideneamino] imidazole-4-carboxamide isomerase n=1 Tax=Neodothiora populina TaxID=2781224 RepID=A0ABR3P1H3_9PEZI
MTRFRPCIDLHAGSVKQIVGGTLTDTLNDPNLQTNYVSSDPASFYADLYRKENLLGAHVIMLGPGNEEAAAAACEAWPGKLQVGGGISDANAAEWIRRGAEKVIITSFLFPNGKFSLQRLQSVLAALDNDVSKLVIDLSCRRKGDDTWFVAMNKWQTLTDMELNQEAISLLAPHCSEFLIHAADNEGLQQGIDHDLVRRLAEWIRHAAAGSTSSTSSPSKPISVTYAGGGRNLSDLDLVEELSGGAVDLTIGSALDIFGGKGCVFGECVAWNRGRDARERKGLD